VNVWFLVVYGPPKRFLILYRDHFWFVRVVCAMSNWEIRFGQRLRAGETSLILAVKGITSLLVSGFGADRGGKVIPPLFSCFPSFFKSILLLRNGIRNLAKIDGLLLCALEGTGMLVLVRTALAGTWIGVNAPH